MKLTQKVLCFIALLVTVKLFHKGYITLNDISVKFWKRGYKSILGTKAL